MLERQGHLPGYTGHIPKNPALEEVSQIPVKYSHIPNYQGFIPSVKAENLIGATYGKITEMSALGNHNKGRDLPPKDKYRTTAQDFTNQLGIHVMPFRGKEYPQPQPHPIYSIPHETIASFYGVKVPKSSNTFKPTQTDIREHQVEENKDQEPRLTYEEARKLATQ
jgi:hypothetical protein